jgi:recombination protein RecR
MAPNDPADPIHQLSELLSRLPGIGERSALRLTYHLLRSDPETVLALARALEDVAERVHECPRCCMLTAQNPSKTLENGVQNGECAICRDPGRDENTLCVVGSCASEPCSKGWPGLIGPCPS